MSLKEHLVEKKYFITGNGKKLNISFVPALASMIYQDYMDSYLEIQPDLLDQQKALAEEGYVEKIQSDVEALKLFNKKAEELKERANKVNNLGLEIITIVLEANEQSFGEVTEKEIFKRMSLDDMTRFIREVCVPHADLKKK